MPAQYPTINGVRFDFSSIEIIVQGIRFAGIKSLNYSHTLEPGMVYGTSAQKQGRTRGQYSAEGSIEIYKADWGDLLVLLTAAGRGFMEQEFTIAAMYSELVPATIMTDTIVGARIKKPDHSYTEGSDPLTVKCDFDAMYILENLRSPLTTLKL